MSTEYFPEGVRVLRGSGEDLLVCAVGSQERLFMGPVENVVVWLRTHGYTWEFEDGTVEYWTRME